MPAAGVGLTGQEEILSYEEILRFTSAAAAAGIRHVRVTGGEPLVRRGLDALIAGLASIPGIADVALTTNGSLLAGEAGRLKAAGLNRVNISIDSLDPRRFAAITRGGSLDKVMAGLEAALAAGLHPVKVNAVLLEGIEADLSRFVTLAWERPVHVRFIEQMPSKGSGGLEGRFVSRDRLLPLLERFGELHPDAPPAGAGPARYFRYDGAAGSIGFISPVSEHFCFSCNRLRLTADGRLLGCLFSRRETRVRPYLAGGDVEGLIAATIAGKSYDGLPARAGGRLMSRIGG